MSIATNQTRKTKLISIYNKKLTDASIAPIDETQYRISNPISYSGVKSSHNTRVTIVPFPAPGTVIKRNLYYDRINLSTIPRFTITRVGINYSDLLPDLNDYFGLDFQVADIVDQTLPLPVNLNKFVNGTLVIDSLSHLFTGTLALNIVEPVRFT